MYPCVVRNQMFGYRWENDNDYCDHVKASYDFERILDFVDIAIFDFIIGNGDRHLYEIVEQFNNTVLLIDNGKRYLRKTLYCILWSS